MREQSTSLRAHGMATNAAAGDDVDGTKLCTKNASVAMGDETATIAKAHMRDAAAPSLHAPIVVVVIIIISCVGGGSIGGATVVVHSYNAAMDAVGCKL